MTSRIEEAFGLASSISFRLGPLSRTCRASSSGSPRIRRKTQAPEAPALVRVTAQETHGYFTEAREPAHSHAGSACNWNRGHVGPGVRGERGCCSDQAHRRASERAESGLAPIRPRARRITPLSRYDVIHKELTALRVRQAASAMVPAILLVVPLAGEAASGRPLALLLAIIVAAIPARFAPFPPCLEGGLPSLSQLGNPLRADRTRDRPAASSYHGHLCQLP